MTKSNGSLPEGRSAGKDLLRLPKTTQEAEKEDCMELTRGPRTLATNTPPNPGATSFFPLRKLKGNQPILKKSAVLLAHLEEGDASDNEDEESDDLCRIEGVVE